MYFGYRPYYIGWCLSPILCGYISLYYIPIILRCTRGANYILPYFVRSEMLSHWNISSATQTRNVTEYTTWYFSNDITIGRVNERHERTQFFIKNVSTPNSTRLHNADWSGVLGARTVDTFPNILLLHWFWCLDFRIIFFMANGFMTYYRVIKYTNIIEIKLW